MLAERVGFEPTLPFRVNTLSKRAPSATRPSLRRDRIGTYTQERAAQTATETFFTRLFIISILGASSHKPQLETICLARSIDGGAGSHWGFATTKEFEIWKKLRRTLRDRTPPEPQRMGMHCSKPTRQQLQPSTSPHSPTKLAGGALLYCRPHDD